MKRSNLHSTESFGYAFIYDEALSERRCERHVAALETRLTSLGLTGRMMKLAMFRSAKDALESMVRHGVTTVVVVGNDQTLDQIMWFLPEMNVALGFLPILGHSEIAEPLGIPEGIDSCDVLAARLIETVDVGMCDGRYFLSRAHVAVKKNNVSLSIKNTFSLTPTAGGTICIQNLWSDAQDGRLEAIVRPRMSGSRLRRPDPSLETRILLQEGEIIASDPIDLQVDTHVLHGLRFRFSIAPNKLRIIAGRNRQFSLQRTLPLSEKAQDSTLPRAVVQRKISSVATV